MFSTVPLKPALNLADVYDAAEALENLHGLSLSGGTMEGDIDMDGYRLELDGDGQYISEDDGDGGIWLVDSDNNILRWNVVNGNGLQTFGGNVDLTDDAGGSGYLQLGDYYLDSSGDPETMLIAGPTHDFIVFDDVEGLISFFGGEATLDDAGAFETATVQTLLVQTEILSVGTSASLGGNRLQDVATPEDATDATTKEYVDQIVVGATNIWIPASEMIPCVTNGPSINSSETPTNDLNYDTLDFDAATVEYAQFGLVMPSNYSGGTVTARFTWKCDAGSPGDTVQFALAGVALGDNTDIDTARGTAVGVSDVVLSTAKVQTSDATGAITIAGTPAANKWTVFEVSRQTGSDNLGDNARLIGVEVTFS